MASTDAAAAPTAEEQTEQQTEEQRAARLMEAQDKAAALFAEVERDLIRAGVSEKALTEEIYALGKNKYGVRTHWHKRLVRSGPHTLCMFREDVPDRVIEADDIVFVDLGPVFAEYEADFGRTYVLGHDPHKLALRDALEPLWLAVKQRFLADPNITGEGLYAAAVAMAADCGRPDHNWSYGNVFCGHLVGDFPHERIPNDAISLYMTPGNSLPIRSRDANGRVRHWILEICLRDDAHGYAGFFEQILTVD